MKANNNNTHLLEITITCQFDGTLDEAKAKLKDDLFDFECGDNISDEYMAQKGEIVDSSTLLESNADLPF